jgi:hypothetical protein
MSTRIVLSSGFYSAVFSVGRVLGYMQKMWQLVAFLLGCSSCTHHISIMQGRGRRGLLQKLLHEG